jgi:hypothetical protein
MLIDDLLDHTLCDVCGETIPSSLAMRIRTQLYPLKRTLSAWAFKHRVCQAHELELVYEPYARAQGWPLEPDFYALPLRVDTLREEISILFEDPTESMFFSQAIGLSSNPQDALNAMRGHSGA